MTPEECAMETLNKYNITDVPAFNFQKIFQACNIEYDECKYDDPLFWGALHRIGDECFLLVNTDSGNRARMNFTKAHELGHYFLNHKGDKFECSSQDMHTNDKLHKPQEVEANQFAGAFLLPLNRIRLYLSDDNYDFTTLSSIASNFDVSLSATVIRTIPLLKHKWCAIYAEAGIVKWVVKSQTCDLKTINTFNKVNEHSIAYKCFFSTYKPTQNSFTQVPISSWVKSKSEKNTVKEMTFYMKNYNATLSLLRFESRNR